MAVKFRILLVLVLVFGTSTLGRTAEDEITIKSIRVIGTLKERSGPLKEASTPLIIEVANSKSKNAKMTVQLDFGDNKKLQDQGSKLVGKRVAIEGRGEYRLIKTRVIEQLSLFVVVEKIEAIEDK